MLQVDPAADGRAWNRAKDVVNEMTEQFLMPRDEISVREAALASEEHQHRLGAIARLRIAAEAPVGFR